MQQAHPDWVKASSSVDHGLDARFVLKPMRDRYLARQPAAPMGAMTAAAD